MNNSIDQQFIEFIVKSLVSKPEAVSIERRIDEKGVLLELTVDPEDLGRVIGKHGATAQSLRTLLRALGTKNDARYNLKIIDNGEPRPYHKDSQPAQQNDSQTAAPASDDSTRSVADDNTTANDFTAADEPDEAAQVSVPETPADDEPSDVVSKTRKELNDLDDLDI